MLVPEDGEEQGGEMGLFVDAAWLPKPLLRASVVVERGLLGCC